MLVVAHAGHWAIWALYAIPVLIVLVSIVRTLVVNRRRPDEEESPRSLG